MALKDWKILIQCNWNSDFCLRLQKSNFECCDLGTDITWANEVSEHFTFLHGCCPPNSCMRQRSTFHLTPSSSESHRKVSGFVRNWVIFTVLTQCFIQHIRLLPVFAAQSQQIQHRFAITTLQNSVTLCFIVQSMQKEKRKTMLWRLAVNGQGEYCYLPLIPYQGECKLKKTYLTQHST